MGRTKCLNDIDYNISKKENRESLYHQVHQNKCVSDNIKRFQMVMQKLPRSTQVMFHQADFIYKFQMMVTKGCDSDLGYNFFKDFEEKYRTEEAQHIHDFIEAIYEIERETH